MKDWLILLCIGIIAFLLFQERGRWLAPKSNPNPSLPAAATPTAPPPSGEPVGGPPSLPALEPPAKDSLASLVTRSQRAAVDKYPTLSIPGSELNLRFTDRYKNLVAEHSPRLQDPAWPMQLADECTRDTAAPPPAAPLKKAAALPVSLTASAGGSPAPSLRVPQPASAVPQTLVFHPVAAAAPPPVAAPKSTGSLPFVTMDAVNQSSGNNYTYNYNSYWWYDVSFRQSAGISINVRNLSRDPVAVNLRWLFFARRTSNGERFVFGAAGKELDLPPGQSADVPAVSPTVQSREVNDYWMNGTRYLSGSKYEGWLVQLVERGSNRVIKQTGSTSYLEDLAKRTDLSALIEKFKNGQTEASVGR